MTIDQAIAEAAREIDAIVQGQRWIVAEGDLGGAVGRARALAQRGAEAVFALGAAGDAAPDPDVPHASLGMTVGGLLGFMHASEAALDHVADDVVARVDAWDPERRAVVMRALYSHGASVAGRRTYGARPGAWAVLDDKTVIDDFWDRASVPRVERRIVPAEVGALDEAHRALDAGPGTVWAIDNREGWTGAALGARWVHDDATRAAAMAFATGRADRVRVMPFLEGVPCSIHGLVGPDHVAVLRPCELLTLRDRAAGRFWYARSASTWDPPPDGRREMRSLARKVGEALRAELDYRGAFTLDGVMTAGGFRPTELNPRYGAALGMLGATVPELDLFLLHLGLIEHRAFPLRELESAILERADETRLARARFWLPGSSVLERSVPLAADPGAGWRPAREGEPAPVRARSASLASGPALFLAVEPSWLAPGSPAAPTIAAVANALARQWNLDLPELESARRA